MSIVSYNKSTFFKCPAAISAIGNDNKVPFEQFDYSEYETKQKAAIEEYKQIKDKGKNDLKNYFRSKGINPIEGKKEFFRLTDKEIKCRLDKMSEKKVIYIGGDRKEEDIFKFLHSIEDISVIKNLYKFNKKACTGSGINDETAYEILSCLKQGRELFISGKNSPSSVKPLVFFYSITAYTYALILLCNPNRFQLGSLNGSHGLEYIPNEFSVKIGGDVPFGTFTDLLLSFPTSYIISHDTEIVIDNYTRIENYFKNNARLSIGYLLSLIPELKQYNQLFSYSVPNIYNLEITSVTTFKRSVSIQFCIGNGIDKIDEERIKREHGYAVDSSYYNI